MTTLTSVQDGTHDAFLGLLQTYAAEQSPAVQVFDTFLTGDYEPSQYVILFGSNHPDETDADQDFEIAALGSYAFYEYFTLYGCLTLFQGNTAPAAVRDAMWTLFNAVVMAPVVTNRGFGGTPVLGSAAPSQLESVVPTFARPVVRTGTMGGGQAGTEGRIEWAFKFSARIMPE